MNSNMMTYKDVFCGVYGCVVQPVQMCCTTSTDALYNQYKASVLLKTMLLFLLMLAFGGEKVWAQTEINDAAGLNAMTATGSYIITADINASGYTNNIADFSGSLTAQAKDDGTYPVISGLSRPLFTSMLGGTVSNIMLKDVSISTTDYVGAIAGRTKGHAVIYNCGILPSTTGSTIAGTSDYSCVGSIVGRIMKKGGSDPDNTTRVINCFSYANVSTTNGENATVAGIVGFIDFSGTSQDNISTRPMVMNCMFYGELSGAKYVSGETKTNKQYPVYGGSVISNSNSGKGINNYNYFREDAEFDNAYTDIASYRLAWPAKEEYLTRFEYYRSILNSNRQLCAWWVTGKKVTSSNSEEEVQTAADTALIAKWVLDPAIAPYPILKKWGKYPSVINVNKTHAWNPKTKQWVSRSAANDYEGKELGTITVNVSKGSGSSVELSLPVLDMDTLNNDYGYAKVQLPYYNEVFGDPTADPKTQWNKRYGGNYTDSVVTGWKVTNVEGGTPGKFVGYKITTVTPNIVPDSVGAKAWEDGFNFADRNCTNKDLYAKSGRVFAQGGYYYVPEGVTSIDIKAYWGKAVYVHNWEHSLDRVNVTGGSLSDGVDDGKGVGSSFAPAGTLSATFNGQTVYTSLQSAIKHLGTNANYPTVYDQAVVLVGNLQVQNQGKPVGYDLESKWHPFTIMSADLDMDNEPDYCMEFQYRKGTTRKGIQPIRFDFLPVPELGMAMRHNRYAYTIGVFIPQGHFEITETAMMHTTQFEYDSKDNTNGFSRMESESPLILNGGEFEQMVVRYGPKNRTRYILMGGNFWLKRFTPGYHATAADGTYRHCAVSVNGGDFPEFYLSGIYMPSKTVNADNPHCYINGGHFGLIAGAGYEQVDGNVTFKIDHALIKEFYGGGINASKPVTGNIDVTINNSVVWKYCGGPKVGKMTKVDDKRKTVTTYAKGTKFYQYFGGGNGGTSFYRFNNKDNTIDLLTPPTMETWLTTTNSNYTSFKAFNPLNTLTNGSNPAAAYDNGIENKGYHALYEFEVFNGSNGEQNEKPVVRLYTHWAQFGTTITGDVSNTLDSCWVKGDFYGGGNLGNVEGNVKSILKNTEIEGSAFGGGFSAAIPSFKVHDRSSAQFPYVDVAGVMHNGKLEESDVVYTWTNDTPSGVSKSKPTFQGSDGKWYCYTWESLKDLGSVSGNDTIIIRGNSKILGDVTAGDDGNVYGGGDASAVDGDAVVFIEDKASVAGNVFGGGNVASVGGTVEVNMQSGTVNHDIYGGGALANTNIANVTAGYGTASETIPSTATKTTSVYLRGGTVNGDVYGGGLGQKDVAAQAAVEPVGEEGEPGYVPGKPAVEAVEGKPAMVYGDVLVKLNGTPTEETVGENQVTLYKDSCVVKGNIFGCNNQNGTPKGTVHVQIYKTKGYQGHMRTGANAATAAERQAALENIDDNKHSYEVAAVYGGGNLSAYEPIDLTNGKTHVSIYGCDSTSIRQVYGGGNAASTPATQVHVYGTYEIEEVFGGGNGKDKIVIGGREKDNPGANVGFYEYADNAEDAQTVADRAANYGYGSGEANVNIHGGRIHRVYGGSNTKGNVKEVAVTMLEDEEMCDFILDAAYGGGKSAPMDGRSELHMACIPGMKNAYGGAEAADIQNDVVLTITNGNFDRVFGGNNVSGTIHGTITVNVEETGCHKITIGQLYGGGNQAAYTGPEILDSDNQGTGVFQGPTVNVKSFTSIGEIYGGGYGATARVTGDTYVNVNVCDGKDFGDKQATEITKANQHTGDQLIEFSEFRRNPDGEGEDSFVKDDDGNRIVDDQKIHVYLPPYTSGIGNIGTVYGGGNAATVDGSTHVNIGTMDEVTQTEDVQAKDDDDHLLWEDEDGNTLWKEGDIYYDEDGNPVDDPQGVEPKMVKGTVTKTVKGANIIGNVYGGGNAAEVTGSTNVTIGTNR